MRNIGSLLRAFIFKNRPVYVHYGITHRCNLRCRMCDIYKDADEDEELSTAQIDKAFDFLRRAGVVYVSIGGGEPFLRNDLPSVIGLLNKKGFMVRLLTNGTFCDERLARDLVSRGLREVSVSLDTLDPEKQAYICNCQGTWEKTAKSIELFSGLLPRDKRLLLINTVVSPFNIKELPQLCQFARQKGYYISFVPVEANGIAEFTFGEDDYQHIDHSFDYLIRMKRNGNSHIFNSSIFLEKSRQYLKTRQHSWQCDAGRLYFSINPRGELSICHRFGPEASLLKSGVMDFLKLKGFEDRRLRLIENCPGCMRPCWAEVSFLMKDKRSLWEMLRVEYFSG